MGVCHSSRAPTQGAECGAPLLRAIEWGEGARRHFAGLEQVTWPLAQRQVRVTHASAPQYVVLFEVDGPRGVRMRVADEVANDAFDATRLLKRLEARPDEYPDVGELTVGAVDIFSAA